MAKVDNKGKAGCIVYLYSKYETELLTEQLQRSIGGASPDDPAERFARELVENLKKKGKS